jgi:hypothetical protein
MTPLLEGVLAKVTAVESDVLQVATSERINRPHGKEEASGVQAAVACSDL